ncbi:hypothetical protein [Microbulbifer sp. GL-2]|uniref:hypothetical protein n=1 Tax=Microbulbifer sp. GL-2 TaxID=2591606 RepID=UPI0011628942|nr:hypothetical protein [Microbulbifer sp. GL-2]BBM02478.1 hypothetical protein GL2_25520 [Microbulbifer sp. GL-2]
MYGKGYLYGLGVAFIVWLIIWQLDKRYYKKKQELLRKRLQKKKERSVRDEEKIPQEAMHQENEFYKTKQSQEVFSGPTGLRGMAYVVLRTPVYLVFAHL